MSLSLYDKALIAKLKKWTKKTKFEIYGPDETRKLFQVMADQTDDKPIKLPIITVRHGRGFTIQNTNKKPTSYNGMTVGASDEASLQLTVIPIQLRYKIDIITRYFEEMDVYLRELIFNLINHPSFKVLVPYNGLNKEFNATIKLGNDVTDNSDIPERLISGQFFRMSLDITIDDAYIWNVEERKIIVIDTDGDVLIEEKETERGSGSKLTIISNEEDIITESI